MELISATVDGVEQAAAFVHDEMIHAAAFTSAEAVLHAELRCALRSVAAARNIALSALQEASGGMDSSPLPSGGPALTVESKRVSPRESARITWLVQGWLEAWSAGNGKAPGNLFACGGDPGPSVDYSRGPRSAPTASSRSLVVARKDMSAPSRGAKAAGDGSTPPPVGSSRAVTTGSARPRPPPFSGGLLDPQPVAASAALAALGPQSGCADALTLVDHAEAAAARNEGGPVAWTDTELASLREGQRELGNRWTAIASDPRFGFCGKRGGDDLRRKWRKLSSLKEAGGEVEMGATQDGKVAEAEKSPLKRPPLARRDVSSALFGGGLAAQPVAARPAVAAAAGDGGCADDLMGHVEAAARNEGGPVAWTETELASLREGQRELGNRWTAIASDPRFGFCGKREADELRGKWRKLSSLKEAGGEVEMGATQDGEVAEAEKSPLKRPPLARRDVSSALFGGGLAAQPVGACPASASGEEMQVSTARKGALRWTEFEEDVLRRGFEKHGDAKMKWVVILKENIHVFGQSCTPQNLKDRWRGMEARRQASSDLVLDEAVPAHASLSSSDEAAAGAAGAAPGSASLTAAAASKPAAFTDAEISALREGYAQHGPQWRLIAQHPLLLLRNPRALGYKFANLSNDPAKPPTQHGLLALALSAAPPAAATLPTTTLRATLRATAALAAHAAAVAASAAACTRSNDDAADAACIVCARTVSTLRNPMLLCDAAAGCAGAAHVRCVNLASVPAGDWLCPKCTPPAPLLEAHQQENPSHGNSVVAASPVGEALLAAPPASACHAPSFALLMAASGEGAAFAAAGADDHLQAVADDVGRSAPAATSSRSLRHTTIACSLSSRVVQVPPSAASFFVPVAAVQVPPSAASHPCPVAASYTGLGAGDGGLGAGGGGRAVAMEQAPAPPAGLSCRDSADLQDTSMAAQDDTVTPLSQAERATLGAQLQGEGPAPPVPLLLCELPAGSAPAAPVQALDHAASLHTEQPHFDDSLDDSPMRAESPSKNTEQHFDQVLGSALPAGPVVATAIDGAPGVWPAPSGLGDAPSGLGDAAHGARDEPSGLRDAPSGLGDSPSGLGDAAHGLRDEAAEVGDEASAGRRAKREREGRQGADAARAECGAETDDDADHAECGGGACKRRRLD